MTGIFSFCFMGLGDTEEKGSYSDLIEAVWDDTLRKLQLSRNYKYVRLGYDAWVFVCLFVYLVSFLGGGL